MSTTISLVVHKLRMLDRVLLKDTQMQSREGSKMNSSQPGQKQARTTQGNLMDMLIITQPCYTHNQVQQPPAGLIQAYRGRRSGSFSLHCRQWQPCGRPAKGPSGNCIREKIADADRADPCLVNASTFTLYWAAIRNLRRQKPCPPPATLLWKTITPQ